MNIDASIAGNQLAAQKARIEALSQGRRHMTDEAFKAELQDLIVTVANASLVHNRAIERR